jgi:hypothetical protein
MNPHENPLEDDPEFYFDQNQFMTLVVNSEEFAKKNVEQIKNLVEVLSSSSREDKDEALRILKKEEGQELLLHAIAKEEFRDHRAVLIAACWESGLDFTKHFDFFLYLSLNADYLSSLEAITVIENIEGKIPDELKKLALEKLNEAIAAGNEKSDLFRDLIETLNSMP